MADVLRASTILEPRQRRVAAKYFGPRRSQTTHCVWHATGGTTADSSLGWLNRASALTDKRGVASYHALIERDGELIWSVPLLYRAYHAGISAWPQPDGPSLNYRSLGFAFCNRQLAPDDEKFEVITDAQIETAVWLLCSVTTTFTQLRTRSAHVRHVDVAPTRRHDPRPETLDWNAFRDRLMDGLSRSTV